MPIPYRLLFFLDNATTSIIEIKRLDLPDEPDRGKVYAWLLFDKASQALTKLDFVAMNSQPEAEERQFAQGQLRFSLREATFQPAASPADDEALLVCPPTDLPPALAAAVDTYLQAL
ncbi:hypothetical protein [Hymenobacter chitinivorans]|uniref:Uncharacterized protein n=1 Tax=Hymenobacter chitinivorans DSM 11115 TaxID=1121954 RepID=A0A2M9BPF4_9BACT|nr:hypothetical protein [Hymenobacter chitinivorans]PJJ59834.1 hypothetical protein CLV45_1256 [Hymenobacter chitinivorans DSM 11115]